MVENLNQNRKKVSLTAKDIIAITCFFLSGFTALIYEICWIRKASLVFGTTSFALSTVISVFFAGMAIGSYVFGKYSEKTSTPLKIYALCEIALGFIVIVNPLLFFLFNKLYGLFYPALMNNFAVLSLIRFVFIVLLLLPPTVLMGGTLPLFCRHYITTENSISLFVGMLYSVNTLGAAIGCVICGFLLIPQIGVNKAIWFGGIINFIIGFTILKLNPVSQFKPADKLTGTNNAGGKQPLNIKYITIVSVLFFISGFAALGNEIIWNRYLSLIIHNTVITYTITLAIILIGIVLGSIVITLISNRIKRLALLFSSVHLALGVIILSIMMLPSGLWRDVVDTDNVTTLLKVALSIFLIPSILFGISFPLGIRIVVTKPEYAGAGVGRMGAINTVGGILGALALGFIFIPVIGIHKSILITTFLSIGIGTIALLFLDKSLSRLPKAATIAIIVIIWSLFPYITKTKLPADFLAAKEDLVDFREGLGSHIAVVKKHGATVLEIDRMWQGDDKKSHQIMAAHVPMILHENPKDVLVIGAGVGQTADRFLYYDINKLDCIDIEEKLFEMVKKHFNASWLDEERVNTIVEDGRNFITHTNQKYDIISIEIGQLFRPHCASFYSVEFYEAVRRRLNTGGIVCQFVPLVLLSKNDFLSAIRSFCEVFPKCVLWYNRYEFLLIGSLDKHLKLTPTRLALLETNKTINKDMELSYWVNNNFPLHKPEVFAAGFLYNSETLMRISARAPLFRDDVPRLEYNSVKSQKHFGVSLEEYIAFIKENLDTISNILSVELNDSIHAQINFIRDYNLYNIIALAYLRSYYTNNDFNLLAKALQWNPYNSIVNFEMGIAYMKRGNNLYAEKYFKQTIAFDPDNVEAGNNLKLLYKNK